MSGCRNFFLFLIDLTTYRTVTSFCFSRFFTSWCYCFVNDFRMACCRNFFGFCFLASFTGVFFLTFLCTGCRSDFTLFPVMSQRREKFQLFLKDFSTYRTMTSFSLSIFFTGRLYRFVFYHCVSGRRNIFLFFQNFITYRTVTSLCLSTFFTGRCYCLVNNCFMPGSRNLLIVGISAKTADHFLETFFCTCTCFYNVWLIRMFMVWIVIIINSCVVNIAAR